MMRPLPRPDGVEKADLADYLNEHSAEDLQNVLGNAVFPSDVVVSLVEDTDDDSGSRVDALAWLGDKPATITAEYGDSVVLEPRSDADASALVSIALATDAGRDDARLP